MFSASKTYCWISLPFLVVSELWVFGSTQLFWLKTPLQTHWFKLVSLASHWIALLGSNFLWTSLSELHWLHKLNGTVWTQLNSPLSALSLSSFSFLAVIMRVEHILSLPNLTLIHHLVCPSSRCHCLGLKMGTKSMSVFQLDHSDLGPE